MDLRKLKLSQRLVWTQSQLCGARCSKHQGALVSTSCSRVVPAPNLVFRCPKLQLDRAIHLCLSTVVASGLRVPSRAIPCLQLWRGHAPSVPVTLQGLDNLVSPSKPGSGQRKHSLQVPWRHTTERQSIWTQPTFAAAYGASLNLPQAVFRSQHHTELCLFPLLLLPRG